MKNHIKITLLVLIFIFSTFFNLFITYAAGEPIVQ